MMALTNFSWGPDQPLTTRGTLLMVNYVPVGGWNPCSGSEAGSYSRFIDFVYHSTLGLRVIKK